MKVVKFEKEFSFAINDRVTKTWPAGWPLNGTGEEIPTEAAYAARRAGAAAFAGEDAGKNEAEFAAHEAERQAALKTDAVVAIPDDWKSFKAAEMVDLARKLGAPEEIGTKDPAFDFISAEVAKRAQLI